MWFLDVSTRLRVGMMNDAVWYKPFVPFGKLKIYFTGTILCTSQNILTGKRVGN